MELTEKMARYRQFVAGKVVDTPQAGFEVAATDLNPILSPHQSDVTRWMCMGAQRACFAKFGLGKTMMQLEFCRLTHRHHGRPTLIICPLGVKQEFQKDAAKMGRPGPVYVRDTAEAVAEIEAGNVHLITNYERVRDGGIDPALFGTVCLDEAAVLRGNATKTYHGFLAMFGDTPFKGVFTATPSPNNYIELLQYGSFLGIMDVGQAKTRWFKRDPKHADNLTLHPHKENEFWRWVASWAIFLQKPSDLGYSDEGYVLPELEIHWHRVTVTNAPVKLDKKGFKDKEGKVWKQSQAFANAAAGLPDAARVKKQSIAARLEKALEIMGEADPETHWLLWHHLEDERRAIQKAIPDATAVWGTQSIGEKEAALLAFSDGETSILATKPEIAGVGCNFQYNCHSNIFMGIDHKFHDFIQAVHRTHRFLQPHPVVLHIIYAEGEEGIVQAMRRKWGQHDTLTERMSDLIRQYGLGASALNDLKRGIGVPRREVASDLFRAVHTDCVEEAMRMDDNCVDLTFTSIPFAKQYEYTPDYCDFGHNESNGAFFAQMAFLVPELLRITKPGRLCVIHVKNRIEFGNWTGNGFPTVYPFDDDVRKSFIGHGFGYMGEIVIPTDVVSENNQTYRLSYTEACKDMSKMGAGIPEKLLLFRKLPTDTSDGYADAPVGREKRDYSLGRWQIDAHGLWRSNPTKRLLPPGQFGQMSHSQIIAWWKKAKQGMYDYEGHVALCEMLDEMKSLPKTFTLLPAETPCEGVWADVMRVRTLNTTQTQRREVNHLCPLPLDIVKRTIERWSAPGEVVFDPFAGLFSVPYQAVLMGRIGWGTELNPEYFEAGVHYCQAAEYKQMVPTLFDLLEEVEAHHV